MPCDADAVTHYRQSPEDELYREYYGYEASTAEWPIYVCVEDHITPTLTLTGTLQGIPVLSVDGPGDIRCPCCAGAAESVQLKGMRAHRCLDETTGSCADGFFVLDRVPA